MEPIGKNTAPAIAIAAINLLNNNEDPVLLVLSADHLIRNNKNFHASIKTANIMAQQGKMVVLGIQPTKPESGYGYIEVSNSENNEYHNINSFTETVQQVINNYQEIQEDIKKNKFTTKRDMVKQISDIIG